MRKRLRFSSFAVALVAVLVVGVPALVIDAGRGAAALGVVAVVMAVAAALAGWLTAVLAGRLARPVEELAEAAARLGRGDPRPLGRRYGVGRRADRHRRDRAAAGCRVGAGLPPGAPQARGDRRARPAGPRQPRRPGAGARHAAGQRPHARPGNGDPADLAEFALGGDRGTGRG